MKFYTIIRNYDWFGDRLESIHANALCFIDSEGATFNYMPLVVGEVMKFDTRELADMARTICEHIDPTNTYNVVFVEADATFYNNDKEA